jgi:BCD family chlorophyll transporter-like MFS transporter
MKPNEYLSWFGIVRLGLVQTALGSIVVLMTSTLNRIMVVELALPAMLPGALVGIHYAVQLLRPRVGHGSDRGRRCTPWILGGIVVLALGGLLAALATVWMPHHLLPALLVAAIAFALVGVGVAAAGTVLLVLLAKRVAPQRRPAAATVVWVMMLVGFIVTAGTAGHFLDPYSPTRLLLVTGVVASIAVALATAALWGVEGSFAGPAQPATAPPPATFRVAMREVWQERKARNFTIFVFVSMLAYSAQDLILEPFAGSVFGFSPGASTRLAGVQHGGVLAGMVLVALIGSAVGGKRWGSLQLWTVGGCMASAAMLGLLALAGASGPPWPLREVVFLLGVSNGAFAVAAIGSMMAYACDGRENREGVRMGLWGASQAIAFGAGGFAGSVASDFARWLIPTPGMAYGSVFAGEAALFLTAAWLAARLAQPEPPQGVASSGSPALAAQ